MVGQQSPGPQPAARLMSPVRIILILLLIVACGVTGQRLWARHKAIAAAAQDPHMSFLCTQHKHRPAPLPEVVAACSAEIAKTKPSERERLAKLYDVRAQIYDREGRYRETIADATAALHLEPGFAGPLISRGEALCSLGQIDRGVADFLEATRGRTTFPDPYRDFGPLYPAYRKWRIASAYDNLSVTDYRLQDFRGAIRYASLAIQVYPKYPEAYAARAYAEAKLGDAAAAAADRRSEAALRR